jgi:hypothetical protein
MTAGWPRGRLAGIYVIAIISGNTVATSARTAGFGQSHHLERHLRASSILKGGKMAAHPRLYKRVRPSGNVSRAAKIILGPKVPPINCDIVDYSAGGACIEICGQGALPSRFELLYGTIRKKCRVVWTRGIRVGVVF